MIALDTSVVVRYLAGLPADQALRARAFMDAAGDLGVSVLVLLETGHVLRANYGVRRQRVVDALLELVTLRNVAVIGLPKDVVVQALARAREIDSAPFADSLIAATAEVAGAESIATFDRKMRGHGLPVVEP